jgi:hypothetical protein
MSSKKIVPGVGLDIGTMNIVSARNNPNGTIETTRIRDAFLDLEEGAKRMLKLSGVKYIDQGKNGIIVVGDSALEMANVFGREARRPLSQGLISAGEMDALEVLGVLVKSVLGEPKTPNEVCYFSIPAAPVDENRDVVYHRGVFERIVTECGFRAVAGNEAMAIIYAETAGDGFSGLSISFGSGMCNLALAVSGVEGLCFSVARGGDWIDTGAAKAVGATQSRICSLKEQGVDLLNPIGRDQEALALYYKSLIEYCIDQTTREFVKIKDKFSLPRPIPIVVSGGTSMAGNFLEFFKQTFETKRKKFPFAVSEIRQAGDPMNSVAKGLLIQAMQESEED